MITPTKSTPLEHSIIYKMTHILSVNFTTISVSDLYKKTRKKFDCIDEFVWSLDVLYILGKIEMDKENGIIKKC
ncbi:ABC-three component system middle component 7 [Vibrio amylolyticus]|uniref:ABC-three component system middle component 7 n=1 Tax=Vibrio amylolyticus TaxID=2847292 RepID=UPI00354FDAE9